MGQRESQRQIVVFGVAVEVSSLRTIVTKRKDRFASKLMLNVKRPLLHVRRQEIRLDGANRSRSRRGNHWNRISDRNRLVHTRDGLRRRLLERRVQRQQLCGTQRYLFVIHAV